MRKLHILKTLIDFFFIILILSSLGIIIFFSITLFEAESFELPFTIYNRTYTMGDTREMIVVAFAIISYGLFVYTIYMFKRIVRLFIQTKIFHEYVILSFNRIGICFMLICATVHLPRLIIKPGPGNIHFDLMGSLFNSFWFLLIIGLFFMVLSSIFKIAKHAREENELTV